MEMHLNPELLAKLERRAAQDMSDADYDNRFRQQVRQGLDQLDRGEYLTHEQVGERLKNTLRQ